MYSILASGYELLSSLIPFLIYLKLCRRNQGKYGVTLSKRYYFLLSVFALYIIGVFYVTGAGTIYDAIGLRLNNISKHINLIPFSKKIDIRGYFLNIFMFLPFGFLIPVIWEDMGNAVNTILSGFTFSLLIELSQILSSRGTDVDDLILNTLGTAIGFLLYKACDKISKGKYRLHGSNTIKLPVVVLVLYLGRCLLFYRLWLIRLIYD